MHCTARLGWMVLALWMPVVPAPAFGAVPAAGGRVVFVSPDGDDKWTGRLSKPLPDRSDGPLATLAAAIDATRKAGTSPKRIVLAGGVHFVPGTVVLDTRDSGLTIEGEAGAQAELNGGRKITGWQPDGDRFWSVALPEVKAKTWDFRLLVVNGRWRSRARLPAESRFKHLSEFTGRWMSTTAGGWDRKPTTQELTRMKYRAEDLGPWLDINNAEITLYHMWDESVVAVAGMDSDARILTFSNQPTYPPGAFGVRDYVVHNVREGMTRPGQWYLDRTAGKVVYWPMPGEDMTRAEVLAPTTDCIIRVKGGPAERVRNVTIRGLRFAVTNVPAKAGGFGAGGYEGAVSLAYTDGCRLQDLSVVNVAGQGFKVTRVTGQRIEGCTIQDTGACGVLLQQSEGAIVNNLVHHVGRFSPSAMGISCQGRTGPGVEISHNEVHDTPYTGVACSGDGHRITDNLIYRVMQELHDGTGIYITFCKQVTVRGNFLRDITDTGGYGASAYYLDEQAEGCLVEENLSVNVVRPLHNHMARGNTIRNNVFLSGGPMSITFIRSLDYHFEKNVACAKGNIEMLEMGGVTSSRDNILFSPGGIAGAVKWGDRTKFDESGLIPANGWNRVDPGLAPGVDQGKVRFIEGLAGVRLGIAPFDVSEAGFVKAPAAR